jgi:hypothetical protein
MPKETLFINYLMSYIRGTLSSRSIGDCLMRIEEVGKNIYRRRISKGV